MANSIYVISKNMILTDYYKLLPEGGIIYEHLGDIEHEEVKGLREIVSLPIYKMLSQISFGDLTIFNNEQVVEGYKELQQIKSTNRALAKLGYAFKVALESPENYILIDY